MTEMSEVNTEEREGEELVGRLNSLVEELEEYPDTEVREKALELVQIILRLYGESLRRIIATFEAEPQRDQILGRMANDEVIRSILLIHGLMPVSLYDRVAGKLSDLRPYLVSQGCDVELLGIDEGRARMRLMRSGKGAPPIAVLKADIENALSEVAPDLAGIEIEGLSEKVEATAKVAAALGRMIEKQQPDSKPALVQIKRRQAEISSPESTWVPVIRSQSIEDGEFKIVTYEDIDVLILNLDGEFYAYQNACADGGLPLDNSLFQSPMLNCSCHGYGYDLRRGNCIERPELTLTSVPVNLEDQKVRIGLHRESV